MERKKGIAFKLRVCLSRCADAFPGQLLGVRSRICWCSPASGWVRGKVRPVVELFCVKFSEAVEPGKEGLGLGELLRAPIGGRAWERKNYLARWARWGGWLAGWLVGGLVGPVLFLSTHTEAQYHRPII